MLDPNKRYLVEYSPGIQLIGRVVQTRGNTELYPVFECEGPDWEGVHVTVPIERVVGEVIEEVEIQTDLEEG